MDKEQTKKEVVELIKILYRRVKSGDKSVCLICYIEQIKRLIDDCK